MEMQTARARENHSRAGLDGNSQIAFAVEVRQTARERLENVPDSALVVFPGICSGVFEIEHDAGSAGVQHFHHEIGFVGRTRHLIALVGTPFRKLDAPGICSGDRWRQVAGQLTSLGFGEGRFATDNKGALARSERSVKWHEEFNEALREIASRIKIERGGIDRNATIPMGWRFDCRAYLCGCCSHLRRPIPFIGLPQN